jgi:uncharacterized FlaG/YvyC family protein
MSDKDFQSISATTGQFPALTSLPMTEGGKDTPGTGKQMPVAAVRQLDLDALAEQLNLASQTVGRDLRFEVNLDSRRAVIQVLDRETGEIIRQIPPEKAKVYLAESGDLALRLIDANA